MRVLAGGQYLLAGEGEAFENEFAAWLGIGCAVNLASGTDAIDVMLRALDIGPGSKVVVPSLTATAVAAGVHRSGAGMLLADCEADTLTLCPQSLDAILRSPAGRDVKAALVVHLYGQVADWAGLERVAREHGILLLEDAAQAHGATWNGRAAGTLGRAAAFSFYPTKNLAAAGDAGAVVTADEELAGSARMIRQYGWRERHISEMEGVNSRMDEVQAAILRVKLRTLDERLRARRELAPRYARRLAASKVVRPLAVRPGCEPAWHQYVVRCPHRDALEAHLRAAGIPVARHYPLAVHQQPAYVCEQLRPVPLPETERAVNEILSLPLHPYLSTEAIDAVCAEVERFEQAIHPHA